MLTKQSTKRKDLKACIISKIYLNIIYMKDIKKEKQEKVNWLGRLETAGELASGGLFLKNVLGRSAPAATRIVPYEGPAVGMPFNGVVPNASQAFRGLMKVLKLQCLL